MRESWEVAVVGAGPAGALVARELAREGVSVTLLDRDDFPRWKVCGACLSPGAQEALRRSGLGELPGTLGARPLEVLRLQGWSRRVSLPLRGTLALSRQAMDQALVKAAQEAGVHFQGRSRVQWAGASEAEASLAVDTPQGRRTLSAQVVVAADGLRSGLMAAAGLRGGRGGGDASNRPSRKKTGKVGLGAVMGGGCQAYGPGAIHMVVGAGGYVGMARTEDGRLNVAAAVDRTALSEAGSPPQLIRAFLARAGAPPLDGNVVEGWKGTPALGYRPARLGGDRILAVGDAAGFVEPFTGEGMGWALAGARALVPVVLEGCRGWRRDLPEIWEGIHGRTVARAQRLSRAMAWTLSRPLPSRSLMGFLHHFPGAAGPFVGRAANPPSLHPSQSRSMP